jgi:hypothetical protein
MMDKHRYIAIIKWNDDLNNYEFENKIIHSITDWSVVTNEEYDLLNIWLRNLKLPYNTYYSIIERVDRLYIPEEFDNVPNLINECKKESEKFKKKQERIKKEEEKEKEKRRLAKEAREKKKFEELKKKFEKENT